MTTQVPTELLEDGAVTTPKILDNAVTTEKILDGNVTPAKLSQKLTAGALASTTSGTAVSFTDIPAWANRITISLNTVSTNGTSPLLIQLGTLADGFLTGSYTGSVASLPNAAAIAAANLSSGFVVGSVLTAGSTVSGVATLVHLGANVWTFSSVTGRGNEARCEVCGGQRALPNAMDRLQLTTAGGADTFDLGNINILYEG